MVYTREFQEKYCYARLFECIKQSNEQACRKAFDECIRPAPAPDPTPTPATSEEPAQNDMHVQSESKQEEPKDGLHANLFSRNAPLVYKLDEHMGIRSDGSLGFYMDMGPVSIDLLNGGEVSYQMKI